MKKLLLSTVIAGLVATPAFAETSTSPITLYVSNDIITLSDHDHSNVDAIAVQDGKILDLGDQKTLTTKYQSKDGFTIDKSFEDRVLTPGFVEPHVHLWLMALLIGADFITPADWDLPWGNVEGVIGHDNYLARLTELESELAEGEPLVSWGYHHYFHGNEMSRELLNNISEDRPIIIWHRSFHELFFNDAAMEMLGWSEEDWTGEGYNYDQLDWERGHAYEAGAKILLNDVMGFWVNSGIFATGMERTKDYIHSGGITTAIDPGVVATPEMFEQVVDILEDGNFPMDYWLMPAGNFPYMMAENDPAKGKAIAEGLTQHPSYQGEQIRWLPKFVKLFSDGAMYSQLMQLKDGYTDGHSGEWLQEPKDLEASMRPYWEDDYTIVIHANGDLGFETALNIVDKLNKEKGRDDHRTSFHHLGITDKDDIPKAVELGANFSVNPYYTHILAELYSEQGIGQERAEVMARGRSFIDADGILSLHSDSPMAPAQPLGLVWAAVNRIGLSGKTVMGPQERITVDEAMKAITINAAYTARLEETVGSIEVGKFADFAVLDESPYSVKPERIDDINITATVYRGVPKMIDSGKIGMQLTAKSQAVMNYLNQHEGHSHDHDICETSLLFQQIMTGK